MQIEILDDNNEPIITLTGNRTSKFTLKSGLEGFETAPIRTSSSEYTERDGGEAPEQAQYYGMRALSLVGYVVSATCDQHDLDRREFRAAFPIRKMLNMRLVTPSGRQYRFSGKITGFNMPIISYDYSEYKIDIICPDPFLYDFTDGASLSIIVEKGASGGYVTPYVLPVEWESGAGGVNAQNNGDSLAYPIITFTGGGQNPVLTNTRTGEYIAINLFMLETDIVVVDTKYRRVTLNGTNISSLFDGTFWALLTGDNIITLTTSDNRDTQAKVEWFNPFSGV